MADDNKQQAISEKELGNQAYKKRQFEQALEHYQKAWSLDNTNISILTNKAGKYDQAHCYAISLLTAALHSCPFWTRKIWRLYQGLRGSYRNWS